MPDVLCVHTHYRGFIEAKIEPNKPSKLQLDMARLLYSQDMPVVFLYFDGVIPSSGAIYNEHETPLRVHDWADRYILSTVPKQLLIDLAYRFKT